MVTKTQKEGFLTYGICEKVTLGSERPQTRHHVLVWSRPENGTEMTNVHKRWKENGP